MSIVKYNGKVVKYGSKWVNNSPPVPETAVIGGKTYPVVTLPDGSKWLGYDLDLVWNGLSVPTSAVNGSTSPQAIYYNYDEATYGWSGYRIGLYYNWYAVSYLEQNKSTLCPGWHVASDAEFLSAEESIGTGVVGTKLKSLDGIYGGGTWPSGWNGTDDYGFAMLPTGTFLCNLVEGSTGYFISFGTNGALWSSTRSSEDFAHSYLFTGSVSSISQNSGYQHFQHPIRLVKDT